MRPQALEEVVRRNPKDRGDGPKAGRGDAILTALISMDLLKTHAYGSAQIPLRKSKQPTPAAETTAYVDVQI